MNRFFGTTFVYLCCLSASAQPFKAGIETGYTLNKITGKSYTGDVESSYMVGITADYVLKKHFM